MDLKKKNLYYLCQNHFAKFMIGWFLFLYSIDVQIIKLKLGNEKKPLSTAI